MRFSPFLSRGLALLVGVGAFGGATPAVAQTSPCPGGDPRFGAGIAIAQCDSKILSTWGQDTNVIITIDDAGFHPREVTVGQGPIDAHVIFINTGNNVHSATEVPSSPMWNSGLAVGIRQDDRTAKTKAGVQKFDTGGITPMPGATPQQAMANMAFMIADFGNNGDWLYSSWPDCLAGDRPTTTTFDCTPAVIHVVDAQEDAKSTKKVLGPGADYLGTSYKGTVLRPLGDPDCAFVGTGVILAPGRNNQVCVSAKRFSFAKAPKGSASKPLSGNVTVTIDDIWGFDPDNFKIEVGTTITFVNKPENQLVHDVVLASKRLVSGLATAADGVTNVNSGGLAPGQSWSVQINWVAVSTVNFTSDIQEDTLYNLNPQGNVGGDNAFTAGFQSFCPKGTFSPVSFDQQRGAGRPCMPAPSPQDPAVTPPGAVKDF
jgi:plastocyanin